MLKPTEATPVHFLLRVPLRTRANGDLIPTVEAHSEILEAKGAVAFGKFGAAIEQSTIDRLTKQIKDGTKTFLILAAKSGPIFLGFEAEVSEIRGGKLGPELSAVTPPYYAKLYDEPAVWFILRGHFSVSDLSSFRLWTKKRPLLDVMSETRTSAMVVEVAPPRHLPR